MRLDNVKLMTFGIILSGQLVACGENSSDKTQQSGSNVMAIVTIDGKEYKMPFVTCQAPHPETKGYTVMALEIEDDVIEGASFRSFGSPNASTIVFTPKKTMDSEGYNRNPLYSAQGSVDYNDGIYSFTGKFDKVMSGKITGTLEGTAKVTCQ